MAIYLSKLFTVCRAYYRLMSRPRLAWGPRTTTSHRSESRLSADPQPSHHKSRRSHHVKDGIRSNACSDIRIQSYQWVNLSPGMTARTHAPGKECEVRRILKTHRLARHYGSKGFVLNE
ncbi:hypothetical protein AVEN_265465-1 [Araneus ventricosus]|uniref:Uncharacterized protein n=1 Tax=Araneus ventricosus TaxID=182803 RepID=A0A4Y2CJF9_ARAVE|nr:hypothetical protein AVEN_265465-1 [Araneus ventricosus]